MMSNIWFKGMPVTSNGHMVTGDGDASRNEVCAVAAKLCIATGSTKYTLRRLPYMGSVRLDAFVGCAVDDVEMPTGIVQAIRQEISLS